MKIPPILKSLLLTTSITLNTYIPNLYDVNKAVCYLLRIAFIFTRVTIEGSFYIAGSISMFTSPVSLLTFTRYVNCNLILIDFNRYG